MVLAQKLRGEVIAEQSYNLQKSTLGDLPAPACPPGNLNLETFYFKLYIHENTLYHMYLIHNANMYV